SEAPAIGQPGRLHHALDVWLPYTNCGIATYPNRAIGMTGLSPARLRPCRPLHQTPVVSCARAIPHPGLRPSGACKPSAFAAIPLRLSCCPRLYIFRGSITRPTSSLPPASYAHCWAGTWSSLLTCWLGVRQVGLEPEGSHPLGNNN